MNKRASGKGQSSDVLIPDCFKQSRILGGREGGWRTKTCDAACDKYRREETTGNRRDKYAWRPIAYPVNCCVLRIYIHYVRLLKSA